MATLDAGTMSRARQFAWNVKFVDNTGDVFAGVYGRDLRAQDLFAELRLVFDFSSARPLSLWPEEQSSTVFFEESPGVLDGVLDAPEHGVQFVVAHHDSDACRVPGETDLTAHQQAGCASLVCPKRRQHSFYLPINQKSNDPLLAAFPFRRRRNLSPSKRSRTGSGSGSPSRNSESEATETAEHCDVVGPSWLTTNAAAKKEARKKQQDFRSTALGGSNHCAVTKLGESWCSLPVIGPGIHAAHIIPQLQYHLYPLGDDNPAGVQQQQQSTLTPADLMAAWNKTWSADNSIILSASIHAAFDQRLLAIHPDSHKIRVFAPYNLITPYHGHKADFGQGPPARRALRWHWNVCVVENMGAKADMPQPSLVLPPRGPSTPPSGSHRGDAEDEDDDGSGDGDGTGPAGRGQKRWRVAELRGLPHGEHSSAGQGHGGMTKRQRTASWLDGVPLPFEELSGWTPGSSEGSRRLSTTPSSADGLSARDHGATLAVYKPKHPVDQGATLAVYKPKHPVDQGATLAVYKPKHLDDHGATLAVYKPKHPVD